MDPKDLVKHYQAKQAEPVFIDPPEPKVEGDGRFVLLIIIALLVGFFGVLVFLALT